MGGSSARSALEGTRFGRLVWVGETGSTNSDLLLEARNGAPEGSVLVADHQTAGRGRLDRTWEAEPASSLLVSVLLRPDWPPAEAHLAATAMGLAAVDACRSVAGVQARLKWPNDVLAPAAPPGSGRKLGGVLSESLIEGDRLDAVVVGIGLNANWPDGVPAELADIAVSLDQLSGAEVDREALLVAMLRGLDQWYERMSADAGRRALIERYRESCETIGRQVRVELAGRSVEGEALDIDPSGRLLVRVAGSDEVLEVDAGDIVHVRGA